MRHRGGAAPHRRYDLRAELKQERELRQATEAKFAPDSCKQTAESCRSRDFDKIEEAERQDMAEVNMLRRELRKLDIKLAAMERTSDTARLRTDLAAGMDILMRQAVEVARHAAEEKCEVLLRDEAAAAPCTQSTVDELARKAMDKLGVRESLALQKYRLELLNTRVADVEAKLNRRPEQQESRPVPPPVLEVRRRGLEIFDCSPSQITVAVRHHDPRVSMGGEALR